jgi:hypothetical protein
MSLFVKEELKQVVNRRFKDKSKSLDGFLTAFPYEFV